jgi:hypothetical protein
LSNFAAEDDGDLVGLAECAVGIEKTFPELVQGGPAMEDEIVTILDLGKEETVLTSRLFALSLGKEGGEC